MSIEIRMPALSPTMEKGTLAKWLIKEGDTIAAGDVIAEIETDKATMEVEAADEGKVGKLAVAAGTADVPVGTVIAVLLEEGEAGVASPSTAPSLPRKRESSAEEKVDSRLRGNDEQKKSAPILPSAPTPQPTVPAAHDDARIFASPLARRIAKQSGIDLNTLEGSGPGGRVVKRDLEGKAPLARPQVAATAATAVAPATVYGPADAPHEEVKLSTMRKVIAERLSESKRTVPHFYMTVDVQMDHLLAARKDINEAEGLKLSVNDFIIKALAIALKRAPEANVQFAGDKLYRYSRADVSVAVAIDGGLITPIIRGADTKGLIEISNEMRALAEKARAGKLMPEDYKGGTISLSNLGMYGIKDFEAVINPPQAAILAVGAAEQRAVIKDGQIAPATVMSATLSVDHRAIDGAIGAKLLTAFKALIENPARLAL
ncbi:MAG: pyruvate dehydrogenase complex dihydrolipoamide acetyltransferase [Proteobacteria bacterium]|nr:MAG: pyruvate dehydrogenase complex dihydrolipoamide acetyltransferase [Pseudomonadota bacterium]